MKLSGIATNVAVLFLAMPSLDELGDGYAGPGHLVTLIVYGPAQRDLGLTEDQRAAARAISQRYRDSLRKFYEKESSVTERARFMEQARQDASASIKELLGADRFKRLLQISWQVQEDALLVSTQPVTAPFLDSHMAEQLGFSAEQRMMLHEATKDNDSDRLKIRAMMKTMRFTSKQAQQEYIRENYGDHALQRLQKVLTEGQRSQVEKLKGAKFTYPLEDLPV